MTGLTGSVYTRRLFGKLAVAASTLNVAAAADRKHRSGTSYVLEVTFKGPFIFGFFDNSVTAYAPMCNGHEMHVETDQERLCLWGRGCKRGPRTRYELMLPNGAERSTRTETYNSDEIITVGWSRCHFYPNEPALDRCLLHVRLPRPNVIAGLAADRITYTESDIAASPPTYSCEKRATAMRLYYLDVKEWNGVRLNQTYPSSDNPVVVKLTNYEPPPSPQNHVPIAFRYAPVKPSNKPGKDASYGFSTMMKLMFEERKRWKPDFASCMAKYPGEKRHHIGDCGAAHIVLPTDADLKSWQGGGRHSS